MDKNNKQQTEKERATIAKTKDNEREINKQ